jgi:hypothetical protein
MYLTDVCQHQVEVEGLDILVELLPYRRCVTVHGICSFVDLGNLKTSVVAGIYFDRFLVPVSFSLGFN